MRTSTSRPAPLTLRTCAFGALGRSGKARGGGPSVGGGALERAMMASLKARTSGEMASDLNRAGSKGLAFDICLFRRLENWPGGQRPNLCHAAYNHAAGAGQGL